MKSPSDTPREDITRQRYRGPSAYVAALGEGAMQTKFLTIGGLLAGGVAAFFAPKESARIVGAIQKTVDTAILSPNGFKKFMGSLGKMTLDFGKHTADAITSIGFVKSSLGRIDKKRLTVVVEGAIFTSAAASILGIFTGGTGGWASARAGRKQFETAKSEILDLRQQLAQKDSEIADLKTVHAAAKGSLKVASDDPHSGAVHSEEPGETAAMTTQHTSHAAALGSAPATSWQADITQQHAAKETAERAL